jgi:putative ABC transport system ATP-binding protein
MIALSRISKTFRSGRGQVKAVVDVSLSVPAGRFAVVMGNSGSGKSTLLNCIGGLEIPDEGEVVCFGSPINRLPPGRLSQFQRRRLGFVFQRGNLLSYLTVAENVGLALTLNGIAGAARTRRIEHLLDAIGLAGAARALPHELSGGETQRVSVARAIAHYPKLLLADEPTASMDSDSGRRVVQLMRDLGREHGCTIMMATHDRDIAGSAEMLIRLKDGRVAREEQQ